MPSVLVHSTVCKGTQIAFTIDFLLSICAYLLMPASFFFCVFRRLCMTTADPLWQAYVGILCYTHMHVYTIFTHLFRVLCVTMANVSHGTLVHVLALKFLCTGSNAGETKVSNEIN